MTSQRLRGQVFELKFPLNCSALAIFGKGPSDERPPLSEGTLRYPSCIVINLTIT